MDTSYTAAGGVVVDDRGRVLILHRPVRGEVRLPKGHVDDGEDVETAARREMAEESGYGDVALVADLGTQVVRFRARRDTADIVERTERYFLYRLNSDHQIDRPPKDAAQFQPDWVPPEGAIQLLTYEAEKEWIRRALSVL